MSRRREWWRAVVTGAVAAVRRFPLPLGAGAAGAMAGLLFATGHRSFVDSETALRLLMVAWLGVPLFLAAALVGARRGGAGVAILSTVAAALLVACYAALQGREDWTHIRFALFVIAAHALLALAPLAPTPRGDFRPFNLLLFGRMALALLLTHVLAAGLSFGLMALEHLFDFRIPASLYSQLWFVLLGVFNTAYVLAGIPQDWDRLEGRFPTPRPLAVLARIGLLPLSVLYLAILYVYSAKILVAHQWPRGWVSAPIVVFAAIGMLTVLLLDPDRAPGNHLARVYSRGFFVALLPLVVLLFLAISRRAFEYGLTEERCLVYAIAVFLAVIAPYFVLSRARHLWAIPLVLAALALLTAVGPLSARALAVRSQTMRLRGLLTRNDRLVHGVLTRSQNPVSQRDEGEIGATLAYLESRDALDPVLAWRPAAPDCTACAPLADATTASGLVSALGLSYRPGYDQARSTWISAPLPEVMETTGFDLVFPLFSCSGSSGDCAGGNLVPSARWHVHLREAALIVTDAGQVVARIPLADLEQSNQAAGENHGATQPLVREGQTGNNHYRLYLSSIALGHEDDSTPARITALSATLLLQASK